MDDKIIHADYKIERTIGRGNFGIVYLCTCLSDGKQYVVKQIAMNDLSESEKVGALREIKLLSSLKNSFIVAYKESFLENDTLNIVMAYCEGGDLASRIRKQNGVHFSEEQVLRWFVQIALALHFCHRLKVIHRDLKTQNIFLTRKGHIRLGDFGIARVLNGTNELAMSVVGTPYSMSPEVCESKPYGYKSDIWALGCVLYELCVLKHAFDSNNLLGLVWKIVQKTYPPIPDMYSEDLRNLISSMLQKDPDKRPMIEEILSMPFIQKRIDELIAGHQQDIRAKQRAKQDGKGMPSPRSPRGNRASRAASAGHNRSPSNTNLNRHPALHNTVGLQDLNSHNSTMNTTFNNTLYDNVDTVPTGNNNEINPPDFDGGKNYGPTGTLVDPLSGLSPRERVMYLKNKRKEEEIARHTAELKAARASSTQNRQYAKIRSRTEFIGSPTGSGKFGDGHSSGRDSPSNSPAKSSNRQSGGGNGNGGGGGGAGGSASRPSSVPNRSSRHGQSRPRQQAQPRPSTRGPRSLRFNTTLPQNESNNNNNHNNNSNNHNNNDIPNKKNNHGNRQNNHNHSHNAPSQQPMQPFQSWDERPISASGYYKINDDAYGPPRQTRTQSTPPTSSSSSSSSSSFSSSSTASTPSNQTQTGNNIYTSTTTATTDDGDDIYSDEEYEDDFEPFSDVEDDQEMINQLTLGHQVAQDLKHHVTPSPTPSSPTPPQPTTTRTVSGSSSASTSSTSQPTPMAARAQALKAKLLRSISPANFDKLQAFFSDQIVNNTHKTHEQIRAQFNHQFSDEVLFTMEQFVWSQHL